MFRTINDFLDRWNDETESTVKIFSALTDESLRQAMPGGRSAGRLANHLIECLSEFPNKLGLPIYEEPAAYTTVTGLVEAYRQRAETVKNAVQFEWTDETLEQEANMYGETWKNGLALWILLAHQTHHRAQITTLMRFAGLKVPGVYGPSREEWMALQMQPLE